MFTEEVLARMIAEIKEINRVDAEAWEEEKAKRDEENEQSKATDRVTHAYAVFLAAKVALHQAETDYARASEREVR